MIRFSLAGDRLIVAIRKLARLVELRLVGVGGVVVDLADVSALDIEGAEALLDCCQRASRSGVALRVADPAALLRHMLELTADDRATTVAFDGEPASSRTTPIAGFEAGRSVR